jgi:hypothetical protein
MLTSGVVVEMIEKSRAAQSVLLVLVVVMPLVLTGAAHAAPVRVAQPTNCPPDTLCLYEDANHGGAVHRVPASTPRVGLGAFSDRTTSWFNRTDRPFCLIDNSDPHISTILERVLPGTGGNASDGLFGTNDKADFVTDFCPNRR